MSRSRASAKAAGTRHETSIVAYLQQWVDDRIERRARNGAKDRGDVSGFRVLGNRVVIECKDYGGRIDAATWTREAATEAGNDDAIAGVVVAKRRGTQHPGDQWVLMTVDDLIALTTGARPENT